MNFAVRCGVVLSCCALLFSKVCALAGESPLVVRLFSYLQQPIEQLSIKAPFAVSGVTSRSFSEGKFVAFAIGDTVALRDIRTGRTILKDNRLLLRALTPEGICLEVGGQQSRYPGTLSITRNLRKSSGESGNGLHISNQVSREEYVASVVASEMPLQAGMQAMLAQAVLTNTLLERLNGHEEIDDSTELQSYKGLPLSRPSARQAARQVSKEILAFHGKPVHVFFHSTCAGMTSTANDVFGGNNEGYPYLQNIVCKFCEQSPFWQEHTSTIPWQRFATVFGTKLPIVQATDKAKRPTLMQYFSSKKEVETSGYAFWLKLGQKFGWDKCPGTRFSIRGTEGGVEIKSRGAGHGVGLCQWGAIGMAEKGMSYKEILQFYFPGTNVLSSGVKPPAA